jgi:N6-adenosine-specific RNA methylase IME4
VLARLRSKNISKKKLSMKLHPVASLFPMMEGHDFEELVEDIKRNGLREEIYVHPDDESIVDGRNRFRACKKAGVEPRFRKWDGQGSLVGFVISLNLKRRHLSTTQRGIVGEEALPMIEKEATVVLDPPWDWGDEGDSDQLGRARPTYATMTIEEIAALPIPAVAAANAHIYLWITNRSLPKGFALLESWGFRYITMLTWVKPSFGMGNYFRGSTEQVLFGVKGSLPLLRNDVGTHFLADRAGQHSSKPPAFFDLVETCSPGPWLEMFSRQPRPGWAAWGAEAVQMQQPFESQPEVPNVRTTNMETITAMIPGSEALVENNGIPNGEDRSGGGVGEL